MMPWIADGMLLLLLASCFSLARADLRIEVVKEGLTDLKTTILKSPNVTLFTGSSQLPPENGIVGELVAFTPLDACSPIQPSKYTEHGKEGGMELTTVNKLNDNVVALISRSGGCSFAQKFNNVRAVKNVVGVLIFNGPNDEMPSSPIELSNEFMDVPGYLISHSLGMELLRKIFKYRGPPGTADDKILGEDFQNPAQAASSTPYVSIMLVPDQVSIASERANRIYHYSLIVIILILALAFGVSIIVHMRNSPYMSRSVHGDSRSDGRNSSLPPIDVEFLQKLPLKTYRGRRVSAKDKGAANGNSQQGEKQAASGLSESHSGIISPTAYSTDSVADGAGVGSGSGGKGRNASFFEMIDHNWPMNESCPICLDEFNTGEVLNELPCGHCYHIACIQPWLQYRSPCCPLCKLDVREEYNPGNGKKNSMLAAAGGSDLEANQRQALDSRGKLKRMFEKLILKSNRTTAAASDASHATARRPSDHANSNVQRPVSPTALEPPPRAVLQGERNGFQSISLTNED